MGACLSLKQPSTPENDPKMEKLVVLWEREQDVRQVYDVAEQLGKGSISSVHAVRTKAIAGSANYGDEGVLSALEKKGAIDSCLYALKEIDTTLVQPSHLQEMYNEIELLRRLDHPGVIRAFEVYKPNANTISIVMELCSGGNLTERTPYTETQCRRIVRQMCQSVLYLHKQNVIHRDLEVENVLFETSSLHNWTVKLIDFGLARRHACNETLHGRVGTAYTMSPQVLQGNYSRPADMWSIGVITYQLLSGERPFWGESQKEITRRVMQAEFNFDGPIWQLVSVQAKSFIRHLLTVDPDKRYSAKQALKHSWLFHSPEVPVEANVASEALQSMVNFADASDFQKIAFQIMARKSTSKDVSELRRVFAELDQSNEGFISLAEFRKAMCSGLNPVSEIDAIFRKLDIDETGKLKYTEFLAATLQAQSRMGEQRYAEAFDRMDCDDTGYISRENIRSILGGDETASITDDYLDEFVQQVDVNNDGRISYSEFKQAVMKAKTGGEVH